MHYGTFARYNVIGAILWVSLFVGGGYFFGNIPFIKKNFSLVTLSIVILSVMPIFIEFAKAHFKKQ